MKILFTCGGTAGHVNPAVALARHASRSAAAGSRVLFVGAEGGMEEPAGPQGGLCDLETVTITILLAHRQPRRPSSTT